MTGTEIREARLARGLSQHEMAECVMETAELLGLEIAQVMRFHISRWETGFYKPNPINRTLLVKTFQRLPLPVTA